MALGTTELKQKKAAGVGSDDLYQLKYTPEESNGLGNTLAKQSKASLVGQSVGQTALQDDSQTDELLELWYAIDSVGFDWFCFIINSGLSCSVASISFERKLCLFQILGPCNACLPVSLPKPVSRTLKSLPCCLL